MTEKLYYLDSHMAAFSAVVTGCVPKGDRWAVTLDRSAFFPEGGGQPGDRGRLGDAAVLDTRERDGETLHICDRPLDVGAAVAGTVDWPLRFARMQLHSGEHIVSGHAHNAFGCENVGFHMTEAGAVIDFDRELDSDQLARLQTMANESVWADLPVGTLFPTPEELSLITFRQKKELAGQIRLVEIPGVDRCACCAPHVNATGEIGLILLTEPMRHRGGMRLTVLAGRSALAYADAQYRAAGELSRLFSAPKTELPAAAERLLSEQERLKNALAERERQFVTLFAEYICASEFTDPEENLCVFQDKELSPAALRTLADILADRRPGLSAVFAGDDEAGWRYVIASRTEDLRPLAKALNAALRGRGGGSREMIQGSVTAGRTEILLYFHPEGGEP